MADLPALPADERVLLLLGLLTSQDRHGYEINEWIEKQLHCVTDLKKATAYQLLDRLEQHGLITSRLEQYGQRPNRKVYSLTAAGQAHFLALLTAQAGHTAALRLPDNVPVLFWEHLSAAQQKAALQARLTEQEAYRATVTSMLDFAGLSLGVRLAAQRVLKLTEADIAWTRDLLRQTKRGGQP